MRSTGVEVIEIIPTRLSISYERVQSRMEGNTTHSSPELRDCRCSSCPSGTQLPQRRIQCFQHSGLRRAHYTHFQVAKIYHRNSSIKCGLQQ